MASISFSRRDADVPGHMAVRNAAIAFACLLAGLLCDALATVPGTAPLLWLPAGVGLAAMLVWGNRAWPGILVSAVFLEFLSLRDAPASLPLALSCAVSTGLAIACQAMLATALVRGREHQPLRLDSVTEVLRFGLLWSPVAALCGAAGALFAAFATGLIAPGALPRFALFCWFGHWAGMVLGAPALLVLGAGSRSDWAGRRKSVVLVTVASLLAALTIVRFEARRADELQRAAFDAYAGSIAQGFLREWEAIRDGASAMRSLFAAAERVDDAGFRVFSDGLLRRVQGVTSTAWAPRVPAAEQAAFETAVRTALLPSFRISAPAAGLLKEVAPRGDAWPVVFVEPAAASSLAGSDLLGFAGSVDVLARVRQTGDVLALPPSQALRGAAGEWTVLFVAAVNASGVVSGLAPLDGVVSVTARPLLILERLVARGEGDALAHFRLNDVSGAEPVPLVVLGPEPPTKTAGLPRFLRRIEIGGRVWELSAEASPRYLGTQFAVSQTVPAMAAFVGAALLLAITLLTSGHAARVEHDVEERTAELAARNRQLRNEIAEREAAEEREREARRGFLDGLAFAGIGSWDHDLESGRLTGTPELGRIYGLPAGDFDLDMDALVERLHPDDRQHFQEALKACVLAGGFLSLDVRILPPGGEMRWLSSRGRHRLDRAGRPHVVGVSWDITERMATAARAKLMAMTFERVGEALFISDGDLRIVEVNPAFGTLTGISTRIAPGMDVFEIFAERGSRDQFRSSALIALDRGTWQGEVWGRGAGGMARPFWLVLSVVRDEVGEPVNYVGSFVDISDRKGAEAKIEFLAHHDALTGLPNRFSLQSRVEQALAQTVRANERLALMFIDMDRFKLINDSLGHDVGDQLLLEIARRLRNAVRSSDIVARLGGDEFVVALPGAGDDDAIARMAEKIRQELSAAYNLRARLLHSSPSIGIAIAPVHGTTVETLMRNADAAMYRAKDLGRNNFQFFDQALSERARERLELAGDLRGAVERDELRLHFQPQIRADDGFYVAAEALIRWQHPTRGMVAPDQFIGIAEEFGLIDAIGDWALHAACRELASLNALGVRDLRVCVNLSAKQLRDRELPDRVAAAIAASGINAADLELELTESMAMQDPQSTIKLLKELYDSGVGLAIDDFGTGYSSLSYLKMLPLHNIKLDRSFVNDIDTEPGGRAICSATVAMAHALGIKVVAEGVETEIQRDFLMALGCDYLQGWLFSKALPPDEFAALLLKSRVFV